MDHEQSDSGNNRKLIASFIVILAVVIVTVGVSFFTNKDQTTDTASTATTGTTVTDNAGRDAATNPSGSSSTATGSASAYKDGTYSANGSYATPEGQESITVNVTIENGTVTGTSLGQNGSNRQTKDYQAKFASGYERQVIGKALSDISLSRVSGSSLTSNGFNKALETIKNQAQS